ncbi:Hypothetical protein FKW44_020587 [Caligus rogercresseyi]|uniref:Uncharacterized protein n=1 Tax=Caligus rogercresseyi TaxID=217165 RepID=A0A7T8JZ88_CALRO|nr:Hypothetical protein FKW44_020587 [Caligus rogercresseyi]
MNPGVESIKTHPPNATFSIDNAIEDDESNSIDGEPLTFSDFISFPTKDFMKELQR